jgi:hypothetical protein
MKILRILLFVLLPVVVVRAQLAVTDSAAQALLTQGNANFLKEMATQLTKLDTQITHLQNIESQGQQLLNIVGNPSQALGFLSGSTGLGTSALTGNSLFKSMESIASGANGSRSLLNTGGGIFQAIPTTTPNGLQVLRDPNAYKKFDAFEQELGNFTSILQQAQQQRQQLLDQLKTVMTSTPSTQAEQSEKISRINALSAQLTANDQVIHDASDQRQAQNEANAQDSEKQKQAKQDEINTEFDQAQQKADQQAQDAMSSILNQKP